MKIIIIIFALVLQSCGTWKWVEPIGPSHANNHRYAAIDCENCDEID